MKKIGIVLFMFTLLFTTAFTTTSFASNDLETTNDVYEIAVQKNLIHLNKEGKVEFLGDQESLNGNKDLYVELLEKIESINFLIDKDIAWIDQDYSFVLLSPKEIEEAVFNQAVENIDQKQIIIDDVNSVEKDGFSTFAVDPGYPTISLTNLVRKNRQELENIYNSTLKVHPTGAYSAAVGYFVGKVKPGGSWDYKVVPGYRYWYKMWTAYTYSGTKYINTEYIGNYNYGFVGEFLFSERILLLGGSAVGSGVGVPEDENDKAPIRAGFRDAVKYW